jgi:hypothetical protein
MDAGLSFIFAVINVYFSFKLLLNTESQTFLIKSSN